MRTTFADIITELRMLLAERLILLASYVMTADSEDTAIWRRHLNAACAEIDASLDCAAAEEPRP